MGLSEVKGMVRNRLGWLFPATLACAALLAETGGESLRLVLRYDRAGLAAGELWRLASGHLVHLGWSHLWLNLAGLLLVWVLVGGVFSILQWCLIAIAAIAAMDAGFWFLKPELGWYVGMSGLLHGLFVAGLAGALINLPGMRREAGILLLLVAGKLAYEAWSGSLPGSSRRPIYTAPSAASPRACWPHWSRGPGGEFVSRRRRRYNRRTFPVPAARGPRAELQ
jgi:rhomboid family GlyGly-CTERM serine protease